MSRHGSQAAGNSLVATQYFHVATVLCFSVVTMSRQMFPCRDKDDHDKRLGVAPFVLQQAWSRKGFLCRDRGFLCRDKVWSKPGVSMSQQSISVPRKDLML